MKGMTRSQSMLSIWVESNLASPAPASIQLVKLVNSVFFFFLSKVAEALSTRTSKGATFGVLGGAASGLVLMLVRPRQGFRMSDELWIQSLIH